MTTSKASTLEDLRITTRLPQPPPLLITPPDDTEFGGFTRLADMPSRAPKGSRAIDRDDPYFSDLWDGSKNAVWDSSWKRADLIETGRLSDTVKSREQLHRCSVTELWHSGRRPMQQLASALMWRTITGQQLAAFAGTAGWFTSRNGEHPLCANDLWAHGLIRTGSLNASRPGSTPTLVRPGSFGTFDQLAAPLDISQWLAVTGGVSPTSGSQYARHNVLAAELGLRLAEFTDLHAVLGEQVGRLSAITGSTAAGNRAADLVAIRADGLKICFEVTTTIRANAEQKIRDWVDLLSTVADRSVAVVFVAAQDPRDLKSPMDTALRAAMSRTLLRDPKARAANLAQRVFVADWSDWFSTDRIAADFADLPVWGLRKDTTSPTGQTDGWRVIRLGDVTKTPWAPSTQDQIDATARMLTGSHHLLGMPAFLRDDRAGEHALPRLHAALARKSGLSHVPRLPYARSEKHDRPAPDPAETAATFTPGHAPLPVLPRRTKQT